MNFAGKGSKVQYVNSFLDAKNLYYSSQPSKDYFNTSILGTCKGVTFYRPLRSPDAITTLHKSMPSNEQTGSGLTEDIEYSFLHPIKVSLTQQLNVFLY